MVGALTNTMRRVFFLSHYLYNILLFNSLHFTAKQKETQQQQRQQQRRQYACTYTLAKIQNQLEMKKVKKRKKQTLEREYMFIKRDTNCMIAATKTT